MSADQSRRLDTETLAEAARMLSSDFGARGAAEATAVLHDDGTIEITVTHRQPFFSELTVCIRPEGQGSPR